MPSNSLKVALISCLALAVAACSSAPRVATRSAPPPVLKDWPVKIGNPYQVLGAWYYPSDDANYDAVGIASWYGTKFHGLSTANGEQYDMEGVSAAHKTLPLPSYVEVTNLTNGRTLLVRVNDRGPFVGDRIIDLSRRSAELLGLERQGTGQVRVRRVYPAEAEKQVLRDRREPTVRIVAVPPATILAAAHPTPVPVRPAPQPAIRTIPIPASVSPKVTPGSAWHFVQVAALSSQASASSLASTLIVLGQVRVMPGTDGLYRVRIGPLMSALDAQAMLAKAQEAGYQEARIIAADRIG